MRPNILFIMSDDHAAQAISCYGHNLNRTPNLDRIANEGMRLDNCYVTNSICTPSRAAILCGTYNHVNMVTTLDTHIDNRLPNVAKHLRQGGYQTAIYGKWHLGEAKPHQPTGFDDWCVLPGQGEYFDPLMIDREGTKTVPGYATDIITDMSLDFIKARDKSKPFFVMCHHKAPHRNFQFHSRYKSLYEDDIPLPKTFTDDYSNRAAAAAAAKMRVKSDMTYDDLGLVQPEGGSEVGELMFPLARNRKVPDLSDGGSITLIDIEDGEKFRIRVVDRAPIDAALGPVLPDLPDPATLLDQSPPLTSRAATPGGAELVPEEVVAVNMRLALLAGLVDEISVRPADDGRGTQVCMTWPTAASRWS